MEREAFQCPGVHRMWISSLSTLSMVSLSIVWSRVESSMSPKRGFLQDSSLE